MFLLGIGFTTVDNLSTCSLQEFREALEVKVTDNVAGLVATVHIVATPVSLQTGDHLIFELFYQ